MSRELHTISIKNGSTFLNLQDRLAVGGFKDFALPGGPSVSPGSELTGGFVQQPGGGYTSIPTLSAAGGTNAILTPSMAVSTSAVGAAGTSYAPSDTITLTGGTASQQAILEVLTTKLVTAPAVAAGGSGYVVGDQITVTGGAVLQVATLSGSAVATVIIVTAGAYSANVTIAGGLAQTSTTGVGTGATFTATLAKWGVNTYAVQNAGSYTVLPSSPVSQGSTSGSGTGFQLTVNTWQIQSFTASGGQGYANGCLVSASGGAGTNFIGLGVTNPIGEPVSFQFTGFSSYPPGGFMMFVQANGPALATVDNKYQTGGPQITLYPRTTSEPVLASAVDIFVLH